MNYFECLSQLKIFLTLLIIEISKLKLTIINAVINILYKKPFFRRTSLSEVFSNKR